MQILPPLPTARPWVAGETHRYFRREHHSSSCMSLLRSMFPSRQVVPAASIPMHAGLEEVERPVGSPRNLRMLMAYGVLVNLPSLSPTAQQPAQHSADDFPPDLRPDRPRRALGGCFQRPLVPPAARAGGAAEDFAQRIEQAAATPGCRRVRRFATRFGSSGFPRRGCLPAHAPSELLVGRFPVYRRVVDTGERRILDERGALLGCDRPNARAGRDYEGALDHRRTPFI